QIGLLERRRIVDAVADEGNAFAPLLQLLDDLGLLFRMNPGKDVSSRDADLLRDGSGRERVVATDQIDCLALLSELSHYIRRMRFDAVPQGEQADEPVVGGQAK